MSHEVPGPTTMLTATILSFNGLRPAIRIPAALAFALAGGALGAICHVPLPWLLGALLVSSLAAIAGFRSQLPDGIRKAGQVVAGFAVGVFFTPAVGLRALELGWLMVIGSICSILASVAISFALARAGGCDRTSSFFAMIPGGLAEMAGLAQQFGANITLVSLSQSLRIVTIVMTVPPALALVLRAEHGMVSHPPEMGFWLLALGIVFAGVCGYSASRLKLFNAWLLGGLFVGIGFGLSMPVQMSSPYYARIFAQVAIGAALGARLQWSVLKALGPRFLPATVLATLTLIGVNVAIAWVASYQLPLATGVLATAPGGIAEMSLTAEALNLVPPLVTAWQLVRVILVALLTGPLFRLYQRFA